LNDYYFEEQQVEDVGVKELVTKDNVMVAVYEDKRAVVFMVGQEGQL
jgi:hypothetical protein